MTCHRMYPTQVTSHIAPVRASPVMSAKMVLPAACAPVIGEDRRDTPDAGGLATRRETGRQGHRGPGAAMAP